LRRPKGTGSVRQRGPRSWQLRVLLGTDPSNGRPIQIARTVDAKNRTEAQRQLRAWQETLEQEPLPLVSTGANVTVRVLIDEWLVHSEAPGGPPGPSPTPVARPRP
jgi:hypothetical protein